MLTIADSFDAMTSNRPYNKVKTQEEGIYFIIGWNSSSCFILFIKSTPVWGCLINICLFNVKNGKRMGFITDIDMDVNEGKVISFSISGDSGRGFFSRGYEEEAIYRFWIRMSRIHYLTFFMITIRALHLYSSFVAIYWIRLN